MRYVSLPVILSWEKLFLPLCCFHQAAISPCVPNQTWPVYRSCTKNFRWDTSLSLHMERQKAGAAYVSCQPVEVKAAGGRESNGNQTGFNQSAFSGNWPHTVFEENGIRNPTSMPLGSWLRAMLHS